MNLIFLCEIVLLSSGSWTKFSNFSSLESYLTSPFSVPNHKLLNESLNSIADKIRQLKQEQAPFIQAANAAMAQAKAQQG